MPSKPIFVSHATANTELADKLVLLIETGIGIPDKEVFCTSLEGLGIKSGANFVEFIRGQIEKPKAVILLLTPHYYASEFCLCELGAAWSMSHEAFPLLLPPLTFDDVKGVLLGTQVLRLNVKEDLNQFQAEMIELFGIKGKVFAIWEKRRDEFLEWVSGYIEAYKSPEKVDPEKHKELASNYEEAKEALGEADDEISKLKGQIAKLKELKDEEKANEILEEDLEDVEKFEQLVTEAARAMSELPREVDNALYQHYRGHELEWPPFGYSGSEDTARDIRDAIEQGFLYEGDVGVCVNDEDPLVKKAIGALDKVRSFIEEPSEEFSDYYANNYDHQLEFTNSRFWGAHFY